MAINSEHDSPTFAIPGTPEAMTSPFLFDSKAAHEMLTSPRPRRRARRSPWPAVAALLLLAAGGSIFAAGGLKPLQKKAASLASAAALKVSCALDPSAAPCLSQEALGELYEESHERVAAAEAAEKRAAEALAAERAAEDAADDDDEIEAAHARVREAEAREKEALARVEAEKQHEAAAYNNHAAKWHDEQEHKAAAEAQAAREKAAAEAQAARDAALAEAKAAGYDSVSAYERAQKAAEQDAAAAAARIARAAAEEKARHDARVAALPSHVKMLFRNTRGEGQLEVATVNDRGRVLHLEARLNPGEESYHYVRVESKLLFRHSGAAANDGRAHEVNWRANVTPFLVPPDEDDEDAHRGLRMKNPMGEHLAVEFGQEGFWVNPGEQSAYAAEEGHPFHVRDSQRQPRFACAVFGLTPEELAAVPEER